MILPNLPVTDLSKATDFYLGLGFTKNPQFSSEEATSIVISDTIVVMLLQQDFFAGFLNEGDRPHVTSESKEVLNCLTCESREEVDSFVEKAASSGGTVYTAAAESMPGMYGASIADPDGHIWELMWMDQAATEGTDA
ncbi:VOC family protein [Arthrobacter castelli]|uniref:VOC family protein n=1 Tax=Arthrobacter castelli TaxID=271431 RepID=UPI000684166C|nr:VOC family protein [Arthrobacter castelli]